jgi:pyruvate-formate lyase-activating enzyme
MSAAPKVTIQWRAFIQTVVERSSFIGAVIRSARPLQVRDDNTIEVEVFHPFHKDKLREPTTIQLLRECLEQSNGTAYSFRFILANTREIEASLLQVAEETFV